MSPLPQNFRNVVVIGASAGGIEALMEVVRTLPEDFPAAVFIVQHLPAQADSHLHTVLQPSTRMPVRQAADGEPIRAGTIYVARSDRHLLVEENRVGVADGPPENRFRPAIDALFRSAAYTCRQRVIGVVLSGALNDGAAGMWSIKRYGGIAIVQDPQEARFPDMPEAVMEYTAVDYVLEAAEIGTLLDRLSRENLLTDENSPAGPGTRDGVSG